MATNTTPIGVLDFSKVKRNTAENSHYVRQFYKEISNLKISFRQYIQYKERLRFNNNNDPMAKFYILTIRFEIKNATGRLKKAFKWMQFAGIQIKRD